MQKSLSFVSIVLIFLFVILPANAQEEKGGAYYDLGVFAYEDEDYEGAEKNFIKALEFNSENPTYNHFLGKTYLKMERYDEAITYFDKARALNPDMPNLKYDTAFLFYKMSDYVKAADLFSAIVTNDPSNILAAYYAAISYYNLDRPQQALDYFIAAAEKSPSVKDNGYYYAGICYHKIGEVEKAVEKFEYVRDNADSSQLRKDAVKWLQAIESQKEALKPYSLYLKVGYQYDDNVILESLDQDEASNKDDYATVVYFSGRYDLVNQPDYKIGAGYNHYQTWYDDLNEFDLTASTGNFYVTYLLKPLTVGLSYLPTYFWVDDESYLMRHQLRPEVVWRVDDNISTRFAYSYYRNNYMQNDRRDGHTHEGLLDAYYIINKKGVLFAGAGYEDNNASHLDESYNQWKATLGISYGLFWELNLNLTVRYYNKKYDNVNSTYNVTRDDDKSHGTVSLSRNFFYDWLGIVAEYGHSDNDSNISVYSYKRNVTTLSLTAQY